MGAIRTRLGRVRALRGARDYLRFVRAGTDPNWLAHLTLLRRSRNPVGFTAKVQYKMSHDRRPMLRQFADKAAVRKYVAERVGTGVLTTVYANTNDVSSIDWATVPREYVAKVTHGSGGIIIVSDRAPEASTLPEHERPWWTRHFVRPSAADPARVSGMLRDWMKLKYHGRRGGFPEWCYDGIRPGVLIEELLDDNGRIPNDYKFYVFDGVCRFVQIDSDRIESHRRDVFTPDWTPIDVRFNYDRSDILPQRPRNLERMLEVAAGLGQGVDFVRVDLYSIGDRVLFGELTNYPEASRISIEPASIDTLWGSYWTLPVGE